MIGPLAYIGGKNRLAKQIIAVMPPHKTYVEPFAGGAQVFFHKDPSEVEVLNDLDFEIVNFFRVCQYHYQELVRYLNYCLISRRWYNLLGAENPESLTDIQRAGRFFYLQKNSFGGLILKQHYHYGVVQRPNYNPKRILRSSKLPTSGSRAYRLNLYPMSKSCNGTTGRQRCFTLIHRTGGASSTSSISATRISSSSKGGSTILRAASSSRSTTIQRSESCLAHGT